MEKGDQPRGRFQPGEPPQTRDLPEKQRQLVRIGLPPELKPQVIPAPDHFADHLEVAQLIQGPGMPEENPRQEAEDQEPQHSIGCPDSQRVFDLRGQGLHGSEDSVRAWVSLLLLRGDLDQDVLVLDPGLEAGGGFGARQA